MFLESCWKVVGRLLEGCGQLIIFGYSFSIFVYTGYIHIVILFILNYMNIFEYSILVEDWWKLNGRLAEGWWMVV